MSRVMDFDVELPETFPFDTDYNVDIGQHPDVMIWLVADPSRMTLDGDGKIQNWLDRSDKGRNVTQATAANRPLYVPNQINGYGVARFGALNWFDVAGGLPTGANPHSGCIVLTASAGLAGRYLLRSGRAATFWLEVLITSDERLVARLWDGTTGNRAQALTDINYVVVGRWILLTWAWKPGTKTMVMSLDGGKTWPLAGTDADVVGPGQGNFRIGADVDDGNEGADADIADFILTSCDLSDPANAALLASIADYAKNGRYMLLA